MSSLNCIIFQILLSSQPLTNKFTINIGMAFTCAKLTIKDINNLENTIILPKGFPISSLSQRLQSFALYKQATKGDYNGIQQGSKKAVLIGQPLKPKSAAYQKNLAWSRLAGMEETEAKTLYIRLALTLLKPYYLFQKDDKELSKYLRTLSADDKDNGELAQSFFAQVIARIQSLASATGVSLADLERTPTSSALTSSSKPPSSILSYLSSNYRVLLVLTLMSFVTFTNKVKFLQCLRFFRKKFNY